MVNYSGARMDAVFTALADGTRRHMITRLSRGPATIGELGRPFAVTKAAITKHVKLLERAKLVRRVREGRIHRVTLNPRPMRQAEDWIERYRKFWENSLDALERYLDEENP